jgi:molybdate transport system regulatory protein
MFDGKTAWAVRIRVWVETGGEKILGPGRVDLLELIDRHHSIAAASKQMGMSYRRAWQLVQAVNAAAGEPLVEATTGGAGGGGATLTPRGREVVTEYRLLVDQLARAAERFVEGSR